MPCRWPGTCLCPHLDHDEDECYDLEFVETLALEEEVERLSPAAKERAARQWLAQRRRALSVPLDADWLASVGFKWHEVERSPGLHWVLWLGDAMVDETGRRSLFASREDIGVEVSSPDGLASGWYCWVRGDIAHRYHRFLHVRHLYTRFDLIQLVEGLTGLEWNPGNHLYGGVFTPEQAEKLRAQESRLDRVLISKNPTWSAQEKDETRGHGVLGAKEEGRWQRKSCER